MAPILASATGVGPVRIEDPSLKQLYSKLCEIPTKVETIPDLQNVVQLLAPYALNWPFEEQVDLFHWIQPLNTIDSILSWLLRDFERCLILVPTKPTKWTASLEDIKKCPASLPFMAKTLLDFTATLLHNASNKSLYNTSMADWIAAADDDLADAALSVYFHCSLPPQLHKMPQPQPENLATSNEYDIDRLVALTKGYGSAAAGLGLDWAMAADDSQPLPDGVGSLYFRYYNEQSMRIVQLSSDQMLQISADQAQHRKTLLSTAEIFFMTTKDCISEQFALLSEIRLTRSAHSRNGRHGGIRRRLHAICTILHIQPEVLNSYFPAQPDFIVELVELVKNYDHVMALHTLTALVSRRDGRLSSAAMAELGVGKGQYLGLLPALLRSSLSSLRAKKEPNLSSADPCIQIGLAFLDATEDEVARPPPLEAILQLTSAVVTMPTGISALVDCGLIPTLLSIIATSKPKFIASLATQVLETAITSFSPSISAIKALNGFDILRNRLDRELQSGDACASRALMFGLLTCLMVLVNHEGARFRDLPLAACLEQGGQIAALACNIISEVTNNDPNVASVVNHIHSTPLPQAVFDLVKNPEPCSELLMAIPNVLFSLALTEAGAEVVIRANPFPTLIRFFYTQEFAMPRSRCLLNEMATAVGTSLEDIMRNVDALKPMIIDALVEGVKKVEDFGRELLWRERVERTTAVCDDRSCFIHFVQNFCQIMEQVLQHEDHCRLFVEKGGFDSVLQLYELSIPQGQFFLDFASSLSCPTSRSLHYGAVEEALNSVCKSLIHRADVKHLFKKIKSLIDRLLNTWDESFSLSNISSELVIERRYSYSDLEILLLVAKVQWATNLFTNVISVGSKNNEFDSDWGAAERDFVKCIASDDCRHSIERLSDFYYKCLQEVCVARGSDPIEPRSVTELTSRGVLYRLRIVCAEGAVVRDGVEIDSCASVGTYEMGDIVDATDRCVNNSGIVRYKTNHGWISEMTRGHGREPIAEVFELSKSDTEVGKESSWIVGEKPSGTRGISVPGLKTVATNILAKCQGLHNALLTNLSRITVQGIKKATRIALFEDGMLGWQVAGILNMLVKICLRGLSWQELNGNVLEREIKNEDQEHSIPGCCIYVGAVLHQFRFLLYHDHRERKIVNVPLMVGLLARELAKSQTNQTVEKQVGLFDIIHFAISKCLDDFEGVADGKLQLPGKQSVPRYSAATLPAIVTFLRSVVSYSFASSPMMRISISKLRILVLDNDQQRSHFMENFTADSILQVDLFQASLQCLVSRVALSTWSDARLAYAPAFLLNPFALFVSETVSSLNESTTRQAPRYKIANSRRTRQTLRRPESRLDGGANFILDEDNVNRVMEMGFSRDLAVYAAEMTRSNELATVMDFALNNPLPPNDDEMITETPHTLPEVGEVTTESEDLKDELEGWYRSLTLTTCLLIAGRQRSPSPMGRSNVVGEVKASDSGDLEAGTMILASFLVDLCKHRGSLLSEIVHALVQKLASYMVRDSSSIDIKCESQASCVCHALSILLRCHPPARLLLLESTVVEELINVTASTAEKLTSLERFPEWLSPAIIVIGLLTQPMAAFPDHESLSDVEEVNLLTELKVEHKRKSGELSKMFSVWHEKSKSKAGSPMEEDRSSKALERGHCESNEANKKSEAVSIPPYFPMLPERLLGIARDICIKLLRLAKQRDSSLEPGLMQSVMVLLLHLLRNPSIVSTHMRNLLAEIIISIPAGSKFDGNAGLSALIFRRLVEDSETLLVSMELEIRKSIVRAHARGASEATPQISVKKLLSTLSKLLFREPIIFTRALCLTTRIEMVDEEATAFLLSQEEKTALVEKFNENRSETITELTRRASSTQKRRSKSQTKNKKSTAKNNKEESSTQDHPPSHRICTLLISSVFSMFCAENDEMVSFLSISDCLNILADLGFALPQCASAISTFKIRMKDKALRTLLKDAPTHAFSGANSPPKTFLNFLLHCVIPQDLWSIRSNPDIMEASASPERRERKRNAKRILDSVHAAARVALSLATRPSESRKKVVGELAFALSGGLIASSGVNKNIRPNHHKLINKTQEIHAINAWVELCLAFISPRSSGRDVEGHGSLDIGNIKLLLDHGVFHALLYSLKRLHVEHPMANTTCGLLLLALEILSRATVSDGIGQFAEKEKQRETIANAARTLQQAGSVDDYDVPVEGLDSDLINCVGESNRMEIDAEAPDTMMGAVSSHHDNNENDDYEEEESGSEMLDDEEDDSQLDETDSSSEDSQEDGWDDADNYTVENEEREGNMAEEYMSEGSEDETDHGMAEGWTHVVNNDMEGLNNEVADPNNRPRHIFDAAQAMIGSLIRNGDISGEALAEIEGSLGIRIVPGGQSTSTTNFRQIDLNTRNLSSSIGFQSDQQSDALSVLQRSQADLLGNSLFGRQVSVGDSGTMEFVYGNPTLMSAYRRNFEVESFVEEEDEEEQLSPSAFVLFPGGPSNASRSTLQIFVHPLLSELELPPPNSLVSDLRNHNSRASRLLSRRRRRMGPWNARVGPSQRRYFSLPNLVTRNTGSFVSTAEQRTSSEDQTQQNIVQSFVRVVNARFRQPPQPEISMDNAVLSERNQTDIAETAVIHSAPPQNPGASTTDDSNVNSAPSGLLDDVASTLVSELRDSLVASSVAQGSHQTSENENNGEQAALHDSVVEVPGNYAEQHRSLDDQVDANESEGQDSTTGQTSGQADQGVVVPTSGDNLQCPPGFDEDVFVSLPREMQIDCVNQYNATQELAVQLDGSNLDPAVLAELPEEMRREVIEQDRRERQRLEEESSPADPTNAQEMDNASIIASMAPDLREEVLLTLDEGVLRTLPPSLIAEAQVLRDRASLRRRTNDVGVDSNRNASGSAVNASLARDTSERNATSRRPKTGTLKVNQDRESVVYLPDWLPTPVTVSDIKALFRLQFLLSQVRPIRAFHRFIENLCYQPTLRSIVMNALVSLLHEHFTAAVSAIDAYSKEYSESDDWRRAIDATFSHTIEIPPNALLGAVPTCSHVSNVSLCRLRQSRAAASLAANSSTSDGKGDPILQPVVAVRIVELLGYLLKNTRFNIEALQQGGFERLLDLLKLQTYTRSSATLEHLLSVIELCVAPLAQLPLQDDAGNTGLPMEVSGKVIVDIPRIVVSPDRLVSLCSLLRLESCRDSGFVKVNGIIRRICRIEANRKHILGELASVAHRLGNDAYRDLRALRISMERAAIAQSDTSDSMHIDDPSEEATTKSLTGTISSSISFSTSTSELKLLRVLQTLHSLCLDIPEDQNSRKCDGSQAITTELVSMLRRMPFDNLWSELNACLKIVQVLEGVKSVENNQNGKDDPADGETEEVNEGQHKRLRNSAAGLLARFLPSIEAFFIANASFTKDPTPGTKPDATIEDKIGLLVEGNRVLEFVTTNKILLNALLRSNTSLLDKGLHVMVQIPRFRLQLSFDVKRHWFKTQIRRLRQQASRRYGSLRLHIRRSSVFQDAYFQLQPRNAEEMRGRLHVTFRNEEGVDAGGLSREFFNILAKEMFNPNYALFTSTEDGCTFQPNPNSLINPDHLSYFRFVGRIVGKAITDGYLLDAHFTRSLYKHMLGLKPTHPDMEAIDPDYYGNLKTILENNLVDMGLEDMTFSIEDHSFGRNQVIDLVPYGRSIKVTDRNKDDYVQKVCEHRMTTSIQSQIKSYLDGLYEIVGPELIAIFTPRELELLISGLPDIDVHDLKENTDYVGWKSTDKEITWFWNVLFGLSRNEKAAFLQFVTGSSKVPLSGFGELQGMRGTQKFSIHRAGGTKGALMSAHTCFNSLDLPVYASEEETREKLLLAINEGNGAFGFA